MEHPRGEGGVGEQDGGEGDGQGQVGAGRIEDITLSVGTVGLFCGEMRTNYDEELISWMMLFSQVFGRV